MKLKRAALVLLVVQLMSCNSDRIDFSMKDSDRIFAIENINILPIKSDTLLVNKVVVIEDDKIIYIGDRDNVKLPDGVDVVDAGGRFLTPGLMDMHQHYLNDLRHLKMLLINGITTVRVMDGTPKNSLNIRDSVNQGLIEGPRVFTASPLLFSQNLNGTYQYNSADEFREVLRKIHADGYDLIKQVGIDSSLYMILVEEAKRLQIPFAGHYPVLTLEKVLESGISSLEHLDEVVKMSMGDLGLDVIDDFVRIVDGTDVSITPLIIREHMYNLLFEDQFLNDSTKRLIEIYGGQDKIEAINRWKKLVKPHAVAERDYVDVDLLLKFVVALNNKVNLVIGTDSGGATLLPGFATIKEMEFFYQAGLPMYSVLKAATINGARLIEMEDKIGTVEIGKVADLAIYDSNPIENFYTLYEPWAMIVKGDFFSNQRMVELRNSLQEELK